MLACADEFRLSRYAPVVLMLCWPLTLLAVIFNVVQFIVLFAGSPFTSSYLMFLNSYISIIGAVFATG